MCRLPFCHRPRHAYSRKKASLQVRWLVKSKFTSPGTGHLLTWTADGSSVPGSPWRGDLPKNSTKLLRKFKEKTTTTKLQQNQNLYILQQRLCCHHYFEHWFYVTWQRYEENKREKKKKKKRKEKRHTKQLCKRRYESTGASEAGGPLMDYPVIEPNTLTQFFYYLVKWKVIKNFPFPNKMCYLSIDIIFRGMVFRWGLMCPPMFKRLPSVLEIKLP